MDTLLQIKRFPGALRKKLKAQAALAGIPMRELIISIIVAALK